MGSPERPAVGEDFATTSVTVAQRWSDFYQNLSSFDETVRRLKYRLHTLSGERRGAAVHQAIADLIADADRYDQRGAFWQARIAELS